MKLLDKLTDIPAKVYEGYVWYSNETYPKPIDNEMFHFDELPINPFVVEAMLYCKADNTSIIVKHTGRYVITHFNLSKLPDGAVIKEKFYLPHRMGEGINKVCFQQIWLPEPDDLCNGMPVLTLKAIAFVGFNKNTN